ncbi:hypothetical protein C0991_002004, partial [Blastosporella zonata]
MHVRCTAHVINLVIQAMLFVMEEADNPSICNYYEVDKSAPIHYDPSNDDEQSELDKEPFEDGPIKDLTIDLIDDEMEIASQSALKCLRFIVNKIREYACHQTKSIQAKSRLMVVQDVRTRWNYTHAMIGRAIHLREAINKWIFATPNLHGFLLSPADWEHLAKIVLHPSLHAEWFKRTETLEAAQKDAVAKATTLFTALATVYDAERLSMQSESPTQQAVPAGTGASGLRYQYLEMLCDMDVDVPASSVSREDINSEIQQYLKFEGGRGDLQSPLEWWK